MRFNTEFSNDDSDGSDTKIFKLKQRPTTPDPDNTVIAIVYYANNQHTKYIMPGNAFIQDSTSAGVGKKEKCKAFLLSLLRFPCPLPFSFPIFLNLLLSQFVIEVESKTKVLRQHP